MSPPTILIADDEGAIRETIACILEDEGYQVLQAVDGAEAVPLVEQTKPDLIVSDIAMPNMDGYEFYEEVRANPDWSQSPFIFLSAKGQMWKASLAEVAHSLHGCPWPGDESLTVDASPST